MHGRMVVVALVGVLAAWSTFPADARSEGPETVTDPGIVPNEIVVGFHDDVPADMDDWWTRPGGEVLIKDASFSWVSMRFPTPDDAQDALEEARTRPEVDWAVHDGYVSLMDHEAAPDDPLYKEQWGFPAIQAHKAWDVSMGSHDVAVAVLDTGVDGNHVDLNANLCGPHASFVPGEPPLMGGHFHGSHVAGTVAAVSNNGIGVAGMSQSCLMDVKVIDSGGTGQWSWIAAGIVWAADNGADVISMSFGGSSVPQMVEDAVDHAYLDRDVLLVAAAGNSSFFGCSGVTFPAALDSVMAVASVDPPDGTQHSAFSCSGPEVEIAAPGNDILSTSNHGGYRSSKGTSMATPHISGTAALIKDLAAGASAPELRCLLILTADDIGFPGWEELTGWGRVNAEQAVQLAPLLSGGTSPLSVLDLCRGLNGLHG